MILSEHELVFYVEHEFLESHEYTIALNHANVF